MNRKLVRNVIVFLFLFVVVMAGLYMVRAKTSVVSDATTTVENNGGKPEAGETFQTPQVPEISQAPQASEMPETPQTSETSETSQAPQASEMPEMHGITALPPIGELVQQAYFLLPSDVMPEYLQTEEQRKSAEFMQADVIAEGGMDSLNNLSVTEFINDNGEYRAWKMAGYLTDDKSHLLLIVQYGIGWDAFLLESDKTLYYNLSTKTFTSIDRPIDPYTVEELLPDAAFDNKEAATKVRAYYTKNPHIYYREFTNEGFSILADLFEYWNDHTPHAGFDFYDPSFPICFYQWNGKRFVKAD